MSKHLAQLAIVTIGVSGLGYSCAQPKSASTSTTSPASGATSDSEASPKSSTKTKSTSSPSTAPVEDEVINVPNNINGALLTCAVATDPAIKTADVAVGCRFENESGARVALSNIAAVSVFSFTRPANTTAEISVQSLHDNSTYDVAYFFKGKNQDDSLSVAKETDIKVAFTLMKNGAPDQGLTVKLGSILTKAQAFIKEAKSAVTSTYASVAGSAGDLKDAAAKGATDVGATVKDAATTAKDIFTSIFGLH